MAVLARSRYDYTATLVRRAHAAQNTTTGDLTWNEPTEAITCNVQQRGSSEPAERQVQDDGWAGFFPPELDLEGVDALLDVTDPSGANLGSFEFDGPPWRLDTPFRNDGPSHWQARLKRKQ